MIEKAHHLAIVASMLETLQVYEGDAELDPDDSESVFIPYYAHGRINAHKINMIGLAETAYSALICAGIIKTI